MTNVLLKVYQNVVRMLLMLRMVRYRHLVDLSLTAWNPQVLSGVTCAGRCLWILFFVYYVKYVEAARVPVMWNLHIDNLVY